MLSVVGKLGINEEGLSEKLYQLLSVPNQLNIFCRIHRQSTNPALLTTLQDLYAELWQQQVTAYPGNSGEIETSLFAIADELHRIRRLSIPVKQLPDTNAVKYLKRLGLITEHDAYLQFFHQTFYDYVFARSFLKNQRSVTAYLKAEEQSIYVRATLKMILGFLRQEDHSKYIALIKQLVTGRWVRWHIKSLILYLLAYEDAPSKEEIDIVENKILKSSVFFIPFLEAVRGKGWLGLLLKNDILELLLNPKPTIPERLIESKLIQKVSKWTNKSQQWLQHSFVKRRNLWLNTWYNLLQTNLPHNRQAVLKYLDKLGHIENKATVVLRLLWSLKIWDIDLAQKLYLKHAKSIGNDSFLKLSLLEDAAEYDPVWVLNQLKNDLTEALTSENFKYDGSFDHHVQTVCKKLEPKIPEVYFSFCIEMVRFFIDREKKLKEYNEPLELEEDWAFSWFSYNRSEHSHGKDWFLYSAMTTAEKLCIARLPAFNSFLQAMMQEKSITFLRIAIVGLIANPDSYINEAFSLLKRIAQSSGFLDENLAYHIRVLLPKLFPSLNTASQNELVEVILNLKTPYECRVYEYDGIRRRHSNYGYTVYKFLAAIPKSERNGLPLVKRKYAEFERKFGQVKNEPPHEVTMHSISAPLPATAYEKMSLEAWEESFLRYHEEY